MKQSSRDTKQIVGQRLYSLYQQPFDNKSEQIQYKSDLIRSYLSQDRVLFKKTIARKHLKLEFRDQLFFSVQTTESLSEGSLVIEFMARQIAEECERDALLILTYAFQSIPETSFLNASKYCLSAGKKKQLLENILEYSDTSKKHYIKSLLVDLSFDPMLPPLKINEDSSYKKISQRPLKSFLAFIDKEMNSSEFIIVSIGYLRHLTSIDKSIIQQLILDYLFVKFDNCLATILECFKKNLSEHYPQILKKSMHLMVFNHLTNDPRRFFETRLAQYINGITLDSCNDDRGLGKQSLNSVNKILKFFLGEQGEVCNPRDLEVKISIFAQGYKDESKFSNSELSFIKSIRKDDRVIFKGSDRVPREKETGILERKYETDSSTVGTGVWNSSGGLLRGVSSTFFNAQCGPIRNMLVDATQVSHLDEKKQQWYWQNNRKYAAYVGSISGHTCEVVGMLDKYIKQHVDDVYLEQDLHLFLVQLIAVYVKRGYHSVLEVIDVLHDEPIQKLFAQSNVKIDLSAFLGRIEALPYLEVAMEDARCYTEVLLCKRELALRLKPSFNLGGM